MATRHASRSLTFWSLKDRRVEAAGRVRSQWMSCYLGTCSFSGFLGGNRVQSATMQVFAGRFWPNRRLPSSHPLLLTSLTILLKVSSSNVFCNEMNWGNDRRQPVKRFPKFSKRASLPVIIRSHTPLPASWHSVQLTPLRRSGAHVSASLCSRALLPGLFGEGYVRVSVAELPTRPTGIGADPSWTFPRVGCSAFTHRQRFTGAGVLRRSPLNSARWLQSGEGSDWMGGAWHTLVVGAGGRLRALAHSGIRRSRPGGVPTTCCTLAIAFVSNLTKPQSKSHSVFILHRHNMHEAYDCGCRDEGIFTTICCDKARETGQDCTGANLTEKTADECPTHRDGGYSRR